MQSEQKNPMSGQKVILCQVLPTYNEADNIEVLVNKIEELRTRLVGYELRILVVDDNSTDGTADKVKGLMKTYDNIQLLQRPELLGLGSAYMDGFAFCIKNLGANYVGEMDADLQHPPEVLIAMCEKASEGVDIVVASRYVKGGKAIDMPLSRRMVSKGANLLTRIFLRVPVADATSGFRLVSQRAAKGLYTYELSGKGYSFQVQSLYAYKKLGMTFAEVPFEFDVRRAGKTKLNTTEIWRFAKTTFKTGIFGLKRKSSPAP